MAYLGAVEAVLVAFYDQSPAKARVLTNAWWKRLLPDIGFIGDMFMHAEPMNTAADLLRRREVMIADGNREQYLAILNSSYQNAKRLKVSRLTASRQKKPVSVRSAGKVKAAPPTAASRVMGQERGAA